MERLEIEACLDSMSVFVDTREQPSVRAKRRYDELLRKGSPATYEEVLENIKMRDYNDVNRKVSPLIQAPDALLLDNSYMTIDEQNTWLLDKVNEACNK